jgi:hypothetical protein
MIKLIVDNHLTSSKMKATFVFLAFCMALQFGHAQTTKETKEAISNVGFMEGVWKGIGWIKQEEKKQAFKATETVTKKLDGSAILFESLGAALEDSTRIITNAKSILSYNDVTKQYSLKVTTSDGSVFEPEASLIRPSTFEWRLQYAGGYLKYIHEVKGKTWMVKGFSSSDGTNWNQIVESELSKQ